MKPIVLLFCLIVMGCSKSSASANPGATSAAASDTPPSASVAAAASTTAKAPAVATAWEGSYESAPGTLTVPKNVSWHVPEDSTGLGHGKLVVSIDPSTGSARGTIDGPLGPATLRGLLAAGRLTATIARLDPGDHGFIGTLSGDLGDGAIRGTMSVSLAEASALRSVTFQLAPLTSTPTSP